MERMEFDLLFRWFVGLGVDDAAWDHSSFTKNRDRLLEGEIAAKSLAAVLVQPRVKRLLSSDHFPVDRTLIEAQTSIKSFRRKDGGDNDPDGAGRNAERPMQGIQRSGQSALRPTFGDRRHQFGSFRRLAEARRREAVRASTCQIGSDRFQAPRLGVRRQDNRLLGYARSAGSLRHLGSQANTIVSGKPSEPVLIEIDLAHVFHDRIGRPIEQCIAEFGIVMPGMASNAVGGDRTDVNSHAWGTEIPSSTRIASARLWARSNTAASSTSGNILFRSTIRPPTMTVSTLSGPAAKTRFDRMLWTGSVRA